MTEVPAIQRQVSFRTGLLSLCKKGIEAGLGAIAYFCLSSLLVQKLD